MTAAVNRLEKRGFVKRIQDPSDGRYFHVYLTKSGRRTIKQAYDKHELNLEKIVEILTPGERGNAISHATL